MFEGIYWLGCSLVVGACVGSFLNVVIHRVPRGMTVHEPTRSFCPGCKTQIPWWRNIPVFTWILQRGKCAGCGGGIPIRYLVVEVVTAVLFAMVWKMFLGQWEVLLGWCFISLLVSISFIDGEHYVIPVSWCWVGVAVAVGGSFCAGELVHLGHHLEFSWMNSDGWRSVLGAGLGYVILVVIVLLGKIAFGKKKVRLEKPEKWILKEPRTDEEQLQLVLGKEVFEWGEVFYRKTDRIELKGSDFLVDGKAVAGQALTIREREVQIGAESFAIEEISSLSGQASEVVIPREAMGGGDPPFLALIGAFLGAPAVVFTLFTSSLFAIVAAVLGRVGFGKPLPFGPFLAMGALTWMFGGYKLFGWYLELLGF